jgi:hypothetical protein
MSAGAVASISFGKLLHRIGQSFVIAAFLPAAFFSPHAFFGDLRLALAGAILSTLTPDCTKSDIGD